MTCLPCKRPLVTVRPFGPILLDLSYRKWKHERCRPPAELRLIPPPAPANANTYQPLQFQIHYDPLVARGSRGDWPLRL